MSAGCPRVSNVKISFRLKTTVDVPLHRFRNARVTDNYLIVKGQFTYTVYHSAKVGNITGIPTFSKIRKALRGFCRIFDFKRSNLFHIRVDNTTASGQYLKKINFWKLSKCLGKNWILRHNPSLFPGAFFNLRTGKKVIIFKSGNYIILGCKSKLMLKESFRALEEVFRCYESV